MTIEIKCLKCDKLTYAKNIVDLINDHTDHTFGENGGMIQCKHCKKLGYVLDALKLQKLGQTCNRHIKGVFRIPTEFETVFPYVYLISQKKDQNPIELKIRYYKGRRKDGKRLKVGHGPDGIPLIHNSGLAKIAEKLLEMKIIST